MLAPRPEKKKKGDRLRAQQTKVANTGLEDFVDWTSIIASEPSEEEEMSRLAVRFTARMHKWATGSKGESTPISDGKRPKRSSPNEEVQNDSAIISMDSLDRASNDQSVLEGAPSEVGAPLEEEIPTGGPSNVDEIGEGPYQG